MLIPEETYILIKRDVCSCQKRPTFISKGTLPIYHTWVSYIYCCIYIHCRVYMYSCLSHACTLTYMHVYMWQILKPTEWLEEEHSRRAPTHAYLHVCVYTCVYICETGGQTSRMARIGARKAPTLTHALLYTCVCMCVYKYVCLCVRQVVKPVEWLGKTHFRVCTLSHTRTLIYVGVCMCVYMYEPGSKTSGMARGGAFGGHWLVTFLLIFMLVSFGMSAGLFCFECWPLLVWM